jgi:hypothetical protein
MFYKNSSVACHVYHWLIDSVIEIQKVCSSDVYVLNDLTYYFFRYCEKGLYLLDVPLINMAMFFHVLFESPYLGMTRSEFALII